MSEGDFLYDIALFAHYYELDQGDLRDDIPLYLDLARRAGSPIFELGCGSGRLLVPLAQAGYRIAGIDESSTMLDLARCKIAAAGVESLVTLVQADMRRFELAGGYRLGFCAANTLMHMAGLDGQFAVLQAAFRALRAGGLFAIDLPNPHRSTLAEEQTPLTLEKEMLDPQTGRRVLKLFSQRGDAASQISEITLIYDEIDAAGGVRRTVVPMRMRWLYPYEARLLMEAAGFRVEQLYGSYDLEPFDRRSERMILIGRVP